MFPNLKISTSWLLTATCLVTLSAAACGDSGTDNDQNTSGDTGNPNPTGTTGGSGGSKSTATAGRGGAGGSSTSTGAAGKPATGAGGAGGSANSSTSGSAGKSAAGSGGSASSAGSSGSAGTAAGSGGSAGAAAGSGGTAGSAGAAGKAGSGGAAGAAGKGGTGGAGGAGSAQMSGGDQSSATTPPDPSLVANTGDSCQSYTEPADGKCGGWYCGVDQATLTQAVDPGAVCGGDVELLCSNAVPKAVASCARTAKTANLTATNDELRPMISDCVFQDMTIKQGATPDCVNCLIDAAACASDNCLTQCLTGDSPACDTCRKQNNCDQMVFSCGGLPAPIQ